MEDLLLEIIALVIAIAAFGFSVFTFVWRDAYRVKIQLWFPKMARGLPQDAGPPRARIINLSPFDIRIARIYIKTEEDSTKIPFPGPFGNVNLPAVIGARRSVEIQLDNACFNGYSKYSKVRIFAETDTGKIVRARRKDLRALRDYLRTEIAEQDRMLEEHHNRL